MNIKGDRDKHLMFRWRNHDFFLQQILQCKSTISFGAFNKENAFYKYCEKFR